MFIWSVVILVVVAPISSVVQADDWKERFLTEAPTAWTELSRLRCDLSFRCVKKQVVKDRLEPVDWRIEAKVGRGCGLASYQNLKTGIEDLYAANQDYQFHLQRRSANEKWSIIEVILEPLPTSVFIPDKLERPDNPENPDSMRPLEFSSLIAAILRVYTNVDICPVKWGKYNVNGIYLHECDQFQVESAREESINGLALIKVNVTWKTPFSPMEGTLLCDPTRNWAVLQSNIRSLSGQWEISRRVDIDRTASLEFPIPTKATYEERTLEGTPVLAFEWEFSDVDYGKRFSANEFRLSAFGLPEPPGISSGFRTWLVLLGIIGVVIVAIGLLLRRIVPRRLAKPSSSRTRGAT